MKINRASVFAFFFLMGVTATDSFAGVHIVGKSWSTGAVASSDEMQALIQEVRKATKAEQTLLKDLSSAISESFQQFAALQKADSIRENLTGPTAQPPGLCDQPELAAAIQNGHTAERGVGGKLSTALREHEQGILDPKGARQNMALEVMPADILEKHTLSDDELEKAVEVGRRLSNPNPLPQKPSSEMDQIEYQRAESIRNLDIERRSPARAIIANDIAFRAPTAEMGTLLKQMAREAGFQGRQPDITPDNKASIAAYWDYVRLSRTGNPNWYIRLATTGQTGLLREIATMQAQSLDLQIRQYELLRLMSLVLANSHSILADQDRARLGYSN